MSQTTGGSGTGIGLSEGVKQVAIVKLCRSDIENVKEVRLVSNNL
jgi:hypothetical protein